jgi:hypothetical protein
MPKRLDAYKSLLKKHGITTKKLSIITGFERGYLRRKMLAGKPPAKSFLKLWQIFRAYSEMTYPSSGNLKLGYTGQDFVDKVAKILNREASAKKEPYHKQRNYKGIIDKK